MKPAEAQPTYPQIHQNQNNIPRIPIKNHQAFHSSKEITSIDVNDKQNNLELQKKYSQFCLNNAIGSRECMKNSWDDISLFFFSVLISIA